MILNSPLSSPPTTDLGARTTLDDLFRRAAMRRPDAIALSDPSNRDSFTDGKPHRLPWRSFDQRWKGGARWLLLAVPQSSSSR